MTEQLIAGVDCSTQATKVLVVDATSGEVVATGRHAHEVTGEGGARETDPQVWWQALRAALDQTGVADRIRAISVGGQQHGLVVTGEDGSPLHDAVLWNDTRAAPDAEALTDALGGADVWADTVGVVPVASFTVAKWAWLRRTAPDVADRAAAVRLPHDHLTERLSGRGVTDRGDASGTGWWSNATETYVPEVLELDQVRLDPGLLPQVLAPDDVAGEVTPEAASALGLGAGTLVGVGSGDNAAAALGLGLEPGTPVVSLGTSGVAYAVSGVRAVDASGVVAGFADATGRHLPLACTLNCTLAVDRTAELLRLDREDIAGTAACVVLPYLDGERTPNLPAAAGSIVGLRHTTAPQEILRAAYEGAVEALLTALGAIDDTGAALDPRAPLVLIGGGAQGPGWREVVGRLSGRELLIPDEADLVARGAAVQSAAALTGDGLIEVARRWDTRRGATVPAVEADVARIERIRAVRRRLEDLNAGGW